MENLLCVLNLSHKTSWLFPSETFASPNASAFCYGKPEDVRVAAIVVPKNELVQIQRKILAAYVVVCADDPALQKTPEVVDVAGVNGPTHIFSVAMVNRTMLVPTRAQATITREFIGSNKVNLLAHRFLDEPVQSGSVNLFDHPASDVSFPADCADHCGFPGSAGDVFPFVLVAILILSADVSLVNFHDAHESPEFCVLHSGAEAMTHIPCRGIGSANLPLNLKRANALLAVEHLPENLKPRFQRHIGVLKNRAHTNGKSVGITRLRRTCAASPMKGTRRQGIDLSVSASGARHAFRPAAIRKKLLAGFFRRERFKELAKCHHAKTIAQTNVVVKYLLIAQAGTASDRPLGRDMPPYDTFTESREHHPRECSILLHSPFLSLVKRREAGPPTLPGRIP